MNKDDKKKLYELQAEISFALRVLRDARNEDFSDLLIKYDYDKRLIGIWANMIDACFLMDTAIHVIDQLVQLTEPNKCEMRKCTRCGAAMSRGYCLYDGDEYYCSDECLYENYTEEEYDSIHESDNGYWTEWEEGE